MEKYIHAFWHIEGTCYIVLEKIWNYFGDFREGWEKASGRDLERAGLNPEYAAAVMRGREKIDLDAAMEKLWSADIFPVSRSSREYPKEFGGIDKAPFMIYRKGANLSGFARKIGIVGMRKSSTMGEKMAYNLAKVLAGQGVVTVSGLAFGIDAAAHSGAVAANAPTIGILASGIGNITPRSHYALAQKILGCGGSIISEYPVTFPILKYQFLERNRLISALSDTVIIVEAAQRSGALITARCALEQGKNVLAFPGEAGRVQSKGCNNLIKNGEAHLVDCIADVQMHLKLESSFQKARHSQMGMLEQKIIEFMRDGAGTVEELLTKMDEGIAEILSTISILEVDGIISKEADGKLVLRG